MGKIILVTGGTRSGKSSTAQKIAEGLDAPHCFVATCPVTDEEMELRIDKHRKDRSPKIWKTIEETVDLKGVLRSNNYYSVYLVDCLTLWISNLMENYHERGDHCGEDDIYDEVNGLLDVIQSQDGIYIFVTNEVGMGVVPENRLARRYRDLVGLCNREVAARAEEVILVSCGIPLYLKKG